MTRVWCLSLVSLLLACRAPRAVTARPEAVVDAPPGSTEGVHAHRDASADARRDASGDAAADDAPVAIGTIATALSLGQAPDIGPVEVITPRRPLRPGADVTVRFRARCDLVGRRDHGYETCTPALTIDAAGWSLAFAPLTQPMRCRAAVFEATFEFDCDGDAQAVHGEVRAEGGVLQVDLRVQGEEPYRGARAYRLDLPPRARVRYVGGEWRL